MNKFLLPIVLFVFSLVCFIGASGAQEVPATVMPQAEGLPPTAAKTLNGRWTDSLGGSNTPSISLAEGWNAGRFQLWCRRGLTQVNFVGSIRAKGEWSYEIVKDSSLNNCGVESFTLRFETSEWRGNITATYPTTFVAR